jgi:hypothetical protein
MTEYKEGIYFNMPEEEYHELPFFSRSMGESYIVDPTGEEAWYNSPENPDAPIKESSPQMKFGTAVHSMFLEPDVFESLYVKEPTPDDFAGKVILDKNTELSEFLGSVGEKKSGKKEELINRALPYLDPTTHVIWDNVMASFYEENEEYGRRILTEAEIEKLSGMRESADRYPEIAEILSGGYPEVTIIYKDEETGEMCKCRLDYVRPEAIGEVKSFALKRKKNIFKAACDDIQYERYNLQYYIYEEALKNIIKKVRGKKAEVFGDVDPEWLKKFLETPDKQFFSIFLRTEAPFQCKVIEMQKAFSKGATQNVYHSEAATLYRITLNAHATRRKLFGTERPRDNKVMEVLMDEHVPAVMYQSYNA